MAEARYTQNNAKELVKNIVPWAGLLVIEEFSIW